MTHDVDRATELRQAIDRSGYYPEVVADSVADSVAGEPVVSFFVHHEPTFEHDEVRRHLSVLATSGYLAVASALVSLASANPS